MSKQQVDWKSRLLESSMTLQISQSIFGGVQVVGYVCLIQREVKLPGDVYRQPACGADLPNLGRVPSVRISKPTSHGCRSQFRRLSF